MIVSKLLLATLALTAGLALTTAAQAEDPSYNRCWGEVASGLAQYDSPNYDEETMNGGPMGMHSRSSEAANRNGGFANKDNAFNIEFNVKEDGGNAGRLGVANATRGAPHLSDPSVGGNGIHGFNNGQAAAVIDPVTGKGLPGTGETIECSLGAPSVE